MLLHLSWRQQAIREANHVISSLRRLAYITNACRRTGLESREEPLCGMTIRKKSNISELLVLLWSSSQTPVSELSETSIVQSNSNSHMVRIHVIQDTAWPQFPIDVGGADFFSPILPQRAKLQGGIKIELGQDKPRSRRSGELSNRPSPCHAGHLRTMGPAFCRFQDAQSLLSWYGGLSAFKLHPPRGSAISYLSLATPHLLSFSAWRV